MTFRARMLQGRLALHLDPDLLELDLEHCDNLANQFVEHADRKRAENLGDDRNTELLAIADDVYDCILEGNPGLAIKKLTASVPWIHMEDPVAIARLKTQNLMTILKTSSDIEALEYVKKDITPFVMRHYPGSHNFLQEVVALLMSDASAQPSADPTELTEQHICGDAAKLALATRVAGVVRLQAVSQMPMLRFVATALALLDERTACDEAQAEREQANRSPTGDCEPAAAAGPASTSAETLRQRMAKERATADGAQQTLNDAAAAGALPKRQAGSSPRSCEASVRGEDAAWPPVDPQRGRKRDSRGRLMPRALLRRPVQLAEFPELEVPDGAGKCVTEACNVGTAQCIASMVGATQEETSACLEALQNDTERVLRWQLLRAPLDERLLCELVREYCTIRGLECGVLGAVLGTAAGDSVGDASPTSRGTRRATGAGGGDAEMLVAGRAADGEPCTAAPAAAQPPPSGGSGAAAAATAPFRMWISHVEWAVGRSDVEEVESLIAARSRLAQRSSGAATPAQCGNSEARAAHAAKPAADAAELDSGACGMHGCGSDGNGASEKRHGDAVEKVGGGRDAAAQGLPADLSFKLKRLTVLTALRAGDIVQAHSLTAAHLGPLAAQQPTLQAMLSETMQLFMQDGGLDEAEAAARAQLTKELRAHFAAGEPSAGGRGGLVTVLQRGLCAYASWYGGAVSKFSSDWEPCGAALSLHRLVRRVRPGPVQPFPSWSRSTSMMSDASDATLATQAIPPPRSRQADTDGPAVGDGVAAGPSAGSSQNTARGSRVPSSQEVDVEADRADRRDMRSRNDRLRVQAMHNLLAEIFRVDPEVAAPATVVAAEAEAPGESGQGPREGGAGADGSGGAEAGRGPGQSGYEVLIELIRAGDRSHEEEEAVAGEPNQEESSDDDDDDDEEDDEEDGEEEEEEAEEEDQAAQAGGDQAEAGGAHVDELNIEEATDRLVENLQESTERLVEITNIPHAYARVLLAAHDGDLEAAIATVMDVF
eukprot:jgi/Ulvmu1/6054/UM027_0032.1